MSTKFFVKTMSDASMTKPTKSVLSYEFIAIEPKYPQITFKKIIFSGEYPK